MCLCFNIIVGLFTINLTIFYKERLNKSSLIMYQEIPLKFILSLNISGNKSKFILRVNRIKLYVNLIWFFKQTKFDAI